MRIQFNGAWLLALLIIVAIVWGLKGLGYAVLGLFLLPVLAILTFLAFLGVLAWLLRRRMQRRLNDMRKAFAEAEAQAARDAAAAQRRAGAVDVEAHVADGPGPAGGPARPPRPPADESR